MEKKTERGAYQFDAAGGLLLILAIVGVVFIVLALTDNI